MMGAPTVMTEKLPQGDELINAFRELERLLGRKIDAVVCGEGCDGVGLLLFLDRAFCERLGDAAAVRTAVKRGLAQMNTAAKGGGGRVARALILNDAPHVASGEITDKGYINQALARSRRADSIARLFAQTPDAEILVF